MPDTLDIIRDSIVDFSRLQDWMISAKKNNEMYIFYNYDKYKGKYE